MRPLIVLALALAASGCARVAERLPEYGVNAVDGAADRATSIALDKAEEKATAGGSREGAGAAEEKVTRKLDDDDVLVKVDEDYLVGKLLGAQVLVIKSGQKVDASGHEVIPVRRARKGDLKVGKDAYFTTARGDVRRASWTAGAVTDDGQLGAGLVSVGPESELLWDGQVAVRR